MQLIDCWISKDAEVKDVNGKFVLELNFGVDETYKKNGEWVKKGTWYKGSKWYTERPKIAEYLKKGTYVHIIADSVGVDVYTDKNGKAAASIKCNLVEIAFRKGDRPTSENKPAYTKPEPIPEPESFPSADEGEGDLPF